MLAAVPCGGLWVESAFFSQPDVGRTGWFKLGRSKRDIRKPLWNYLWDKIPYGCDHSLMIDPTPSIRIWLDGSITFFFFSFFFSDCFIYLMFSFIPYLINFWIQIHLAFSWGIKSQTSGWEIRLIKIIKYWCYESILLMKGWNTFELFLNKQLSRFIKTLVIYNFL